MIPRFSEEEARSKLGRKVELTRGLSRYQAGTRGTVVGVHHSETLGVLLEVEFDGYPRHEFLGKDTFKLFLAEETSSISK
jgi:hypothetical protein